MARIPRHRSSRLPRFRPPRRTLIPQLVTAGLLAASFAAAAGWLLLGGIPRNSRPGSLPAADMQAAAASQYPVKGDSSSGRDVLLGQAKVVDGDTIEISGTRVRLFGIDAPEGDQPCALGQVIIPCGELAKHELELLVRNEAVTCEPRDLDRYRRIVAVCTVSGRDIGEGLVAAGWAKAYRRYSLDYVPQEEAARSAQLGIWAAQFDDPEEWRHRRPGG